MGVFRDNSTLWKYWNDIHAVNLQMWPGTKKQKCVRMVYISLTLQNIACSQDYKNINVTY